MSNENTYQMSASDLCCGVIKLGRGGPGEKGTSELRPGGEEGGSCVTTGGGRRPGEPGWREVWLPGLGRGAGQRGLGAGAQGAMGWAAS